MNEKNLLNKIKEESGYRVPDVYGKIVAAANAEGLLNNVDDTEVYSDGETVALGNVNKKAVAITTLAALAAVSLAIALPIALSGKYDGGLPTVPPLADDGEKVVADIGLGDSYALGAVSTAKLLGSFTEASLDGGAKAMALRTVSDSDVSAFENYFNAFETFFDETTAQPVKVPAADSKYETGVSIKGVRANGDTINYNMYYTEARVVDESVAEGAVKYYIEGVISISYGQMLLLGERIVPEGAKEGAETSLTISAYPNQYSKDTYVKMELERSVENDKAVNKYNYTIVVEGDTVGGAVLCKPVQEEGASSVAFTLDILGIGNAEDIAYYVYRPSDGEKEFYVDYKHKYDRGNFCVTIKDSGYEYDYVLSGLFVSKANGDGTCEIVGYNRNKSLPENLFIPETHDGNKVVAIGTSAFANNNKIKYVHIPSGVETIKDSAFEGSTVKEVELPDSLKTIKSKAFKECKNLNIITLPEGLQRIEVASFFDCESLQSFHIPSSVNYIFGNIFKNCKSLTSITVEEGNVVYEAKGNCLIEKESSAVIAGCKASVIPADAGIVKIEQDAFATCLFTSFTIPEGITDIKLYAFQNCSEMVNISLPESLINIETSAFEFCTKLKSLHIPSKVKNIKERALNGCIALESLTVDEGNARFSSSQNCIIDNISAMSSSIVAGCKNSVIPTDEKIKTINHYAFYNISTLTHIEIPSNIESIWNNAFAGTGLTSVEIPQTVKYFGEYLFAYCNDLTDVTLPENFTSIGHAMFCGCPKLVNINIPNSVKYISGWAFYKCESLKTVVLPPNLYEVSEHAFGECTNLTEIVIPNSVELIDNSGFRLCNNLKKVTIPASVTQIAFQAFYGCTELQEITFEGTLDDWNAIEKGTGWYYAVSGCTVTCSDGQSVVIDWFNDLNS